MITMTFLFYMVFSIVGLLSEFFNLSNTKEVVDLVNKANTDKDSLSENETSMYYLKGCLGFVYILFTIIGLASSQWPFFVTLIGLSIVMGVINPTRNRLYGVVKLDALLSILIIIFLIVNKYQNIFF